jgi:hypothetical protein
MGWHVSYVACRAPSTMALSGKLEQLCTDRRHKGALGLYLQSATSSHARPSGEEMEHRHIEYAVRMAPGRDQWVWTVHTPNPRKGIVSGNRLLAISRAEKVIDAWYQRKGHLQTSVPKVNYA